MRPQHRFGQRPVRKKQIMPALGHDPPAVGQWPWAVRYLLQVCAHPNLLALLDSIVPSIYPSLSLANQIHRVQIN
jgi:hypothetical protein